MQQFEEKDYTQRFSLSLWRKILRYAKDYYRDLRHLGVCMAITAGCDVVFPLMTSYAIDHFIPNLDHPGGTQGLPAFIAVYLMLLAVQVYSIFRFLYLGGKVETGTCYTIRKMAFRKLQELPFSYYDRMPVGYLMSRLTSDAQRLAETIGWSLLDLSYGVVMIIAASITMFSLNWRLTLVVLIVVPPLAVVSWWFQQHILSSYRAVRKTNSQITGAFNEGIMGAKTTKTLVREEKNMQEFTELTHTMKRASVRAASLSAVYLPIVVSLGSLATAYALWKGGQLVSIGGMSLGILQVFVNYTVQFFQPIRDVASTFAEMQSAQAAAERVMTLLETEPDIVDSPEVEAKFGDNFHPKKENWPALHGDVEFRHVDFQYKEGEKVLADFNLKVKAGETIALVGPTGAGKSTVVNLVCRFYEPTAGQILIDGVDYRERSQLWLQSNLGYVLQEPRLFSGTIRDNIRYARLDATDAEVEAAARLVNAEGFILKLEKGYDTDVGEGGSRLSTGEKQLVSFARAILADPRIFVLDEATSSVDTQTEQIIQNAISKVLTGRTSFIIAHRLSTIRTADRILVIDDGKIKEMGTHQELLRLRGAYYNLYTNQFQEEQAMELLGKAAQ
ncbi:MAG: ABC transporter ATP-binding protein/permease [Clostridiales bacterium]|nr:ABC transporter ATP-binding protein/permease [Clostridiales bacterium]